MAEQNYKIRFKIGGSEIEVEGDKTFVDEKFSVLLKELKSNPTKEIPSEPNLQQKTVESISISSPTGQKLNIKELIANKKPSGALQVAVVVAYYLLRNEGKNTFTDEDLRKIWIASGCKPSKNLLQTMNDCKQKHGWFDLVSRGTYQITDHGLYLVETELPKK
jgi:hypothetical protein